MLKIRRFFNYISDLLIEAESSLKFGVSVRSVYIKSISVMSLLIKYRDYRVISSDPLFDINYYASLAGKSFAHRNAAIIHYIIVGEKINLDPCLKFSRFRYLCNNPDLHGMKMMPFSHFILYADKENRHY